MIKIEQRLNTDAVNRLQYAGLETAPFLPGKREEGGKAYPESAYALS